MPLIRLWVYDGILASSVAGSIDVFTAANAVGDGRSDMGKMDANRRSRHSLRPRCGHDNCCYRVPLLHRPPAM